MIILIDDDSEYGHLIEKLFKREGVQFKYFKDPSMAVQYVSDATESHLFVLDILMPEHSGIELLEGLSQTHHMAICLSASNAKEHITKAISLGAIDYLFKFNPIDQSVETILHLYENHTSSHNEAILAYEVRHVLKDFTIEKVDSEEIQVLTIEELPLESLVDISIKGHYYTCRVMECHLEDTGVQLILKAPDHFNHIEFNAAKDESEQDEEDAA